MAVQGIDISTYDTVLDWSKVKKAGVDFCYIKCSEGMGTDINELKRVSYFQKNWMASKQAGILTGVYHYFHDNLDAEPQADHFIKTYMLGLAVDSKHQLPPMIDVEESTETDPLVRALRLDRFLLRVKYMLRVTPTIYTYKSFWDEQYNKYFSSYPLHIAAYGDDKPVPLKVPTRNAPTLPTGWNAYTFWQHSQHGTVDGIAGISSIDLNIYKGTLPQLAQFCESSKF